MIFPSLNVEDDSSPEVPVLHVLCYRVDPAGPTPGDVDLSARKDLIDWISREALGGDDDAAEWLLLQLTSKVFVYIYMHLVLLLILAIDILVQSRFSRLP